MAELADVIIRLDKLSPVEQEVVLKVLAARVGISQPSTEPLAQAAVLPQAKPARQDVSPTGSVDEAAGASALSSSVQKLSVTEQSPVTKDAEFRENPEFRALMKSVSDCSKPLLSGAGRKADMLNRVNSIRSAWEKLPSRLKQPFL